MKGVPMSLQFILGNSGAGKSHYIYHKIITESLAQPDQQYLVLVPEQFTMQTQKELVTIHPGKGIMKIDVLSFERLAYRVMEELGEDRLQVLEETGKSLVLRKVAQEKKEQLELLGSKVKKPGYINRIKSTVSEWMQYDISMDSMEQMLDYARENPRLYYKLQDLRIMHQGFREYLQGRYLAGEEVLDALCQSAPKSAMIKDSVIVLDGFTGFTPIQMKLLKELMPLCKELLVTVTLDGKMDPYRIGSPHQIFHMSQKTIQTLCQLAQETKTEMKEEVRISGEKTGRFSCSPALAFLEKHLFRYNKDTYDKEQDEIVVYRCRNPREEMAEAAKRIRRLVRTEGYRYKDFAVITGDMESYGEYAAWAFEKADIPCFLDKKHSVLMNPFVEYVRSLIDMIAQNYSYESVFRFLRCGLSDMKKEEIDLLENYVIALGIRGFHKWQEEWVRLYRGQPPKEIHVLSNLRKQFCESLDGFTGLLKSGKFTVRKGVENLYTYIVENKIQFKLKQQEHLFEEQRNPALVKEYSQIYGIIMNLFDKLVDVLGEEKVTIREFQELLDAGLEEAQVGIIPSSSDQVVVGDMERTRLNDIKVLFFAGVNEGMIPKDAGENGILSDMDREYLKGADVELAPTARENIYTQRFYLYLNMTKPSRRLFISYSKSNAKGESIGPAYLIGNLLERYPGLTVKDTGESENLRDAIEIPESSLKYLTEGLRKSVSEEPENTWKELFSWYAKDTRYAEKTERLIEAAFSCNPQDQISKSTAKALYGTILENSATRLERFAACGFAHFMEYGLRLKEREYYEFDAMDLGNVVHTALEEFGEILKKRGYAWKDLTEDQRLQFTEESVEAVIHDYGNTILHSSARNEYMIVRIKRMLNRTVWALQEQMKRGDFIPSSFEISFAAADTLDSVNIELSGVERMRLKGRIDRMDTCEDNEHVYVKVIDYKSGNTNFDLAAFYYGLQLQLVLYLNAAMELEGKSHPDKQVEPAGVFYYQVKDPVVAYKPRESKEELERRILKELRVNGLVRAEAEILTRLDKECSPNEQKTSLAVPVTYNKNGSLSKASSAADKEQFQLLSSYVVHKMKELGRDILSGNAKALPYESGKKNACMYCTYKSICGFDEKIPGYQYRRLKSLKQDDIWQCIKREV